ncbi:MAG: ABC transporter transmembrane domain-containing protein [Nitrospinota bacterium]
MRALRQYFGSVAGGLEETRPPWRGAPARLRTGDPWRADRASLRWLGRHLLREWPLALAGLAALPLAAAFGLAQPLLLKVALDDHIVPGRLEGLGGVALLFALCVVGQMLATFGESYLVQLLGSRVAHAIRRETFAHLQGLSASFYDRNPVGRLMSRLTGTWRRSTSSSARASSRLLRISSPWAGSWPSCSTWTGASPL